MLNIVPVHLIVKQIAKSFNTWFTNLKPKDVFAVFLDTTQILILNLQKWKFKKMKAKYVNPFTDFGFKKIFGEEASKPLLTDFLNSLLPETNKINCYHLAIVIGMKLIRYQYNKALPAVTNHAQHPAEKQ